ncbi:MAG: hypothetical protein WBE18_07205 [Gammaproteobacteria bacterium]
MPKSKSKKLIWEISRSGTNTKYSTQEALIKEIAVDSKPDKVIYLRICFSNQSAWGKFKEFLTEVENKISLSDGFYPNNLFSKGITICWESNNNKSSNNIQMGIAITLQEMKCILVVANQLCPFSKEMRKSLGNCSEVKLFEEKRFSFPTKIKNFFSPSKLNSSPTHVQDREIEEKPLLSPRRNTIA